MIAEIRIDDGQQMTLKEYNTLKEIVPEIHLRQPEDFRAWLNEQEKADCVTDGISEEDRLTIKKQEAYDKLQAEGKVAIKADWSTVSVDIIELLQACPRVRFSVQRRVSNAGTQDGTNSEIITRLLDLTDKYTKAQELFNEKCNVHVGGNELMKIRRLEVFNDACTEMIDTKLDEGWQIVAVCVQANQRRPDYVLGMTAGIIE